MQNNYSSNKVYTNTSIAKITKLINSGVDPVEKEY